MGSCLFPDRSFSRKLNFYHSIRRITSRLSVITCPNTTHLKFQLHLLDKHWFLVITCRYLLLYLWLFVFSLDNQVFLKIWKIKLFHLVLATICSQLLGQILHKIFETVENISITYLFLTQRYSIILLKYFSIVVFVF